ncbi:MAG TPA: hypothetical protein VF820_01850 [Patescibacteria group bacterium]
MIKNYVESFAKYAGIATVCVEWLALLFYYTKMPAYVGGHYPISYFAYLPQTRLVFNICYTLAGIFFWIFIKYHLHKHYPVPLKILGISMLFFIGLALFPFNPNNPTSDLIHSTLGMISAILLIIGLYIMAHKVKDRVVYRGTMIMLIGSLILFVGFLVTPKQSNLIFVYEAGSWLILQLWVFWISFYSLKNPLLKY